MQSALDWSARHFRCFARNGRWGTCGGCPRTSDGEPFPEFCEDTVRYDHQLALADLVEQHEGRRKDAERQSARKEAES